MPYPKTPEDVAAKNAIMQAFFEEALARVDFLHELHDGGHDIEALTLCLTYIDSFAQWLSWPCQETGRNFVDALRTHESGPYFSLIYPLQAFHAFGSMNGVWQDYSRRIQTLFPGSSDELVDQNKFESRLGTACSTKELHQIRSELWRCTMGAVAYYWLRNPSVHQFGASPSLGFGNTFHNGRNVAPMNLHSFLPVLRAMIDAARERSLKACQWFGDDRMVLDA